MVPLNPATALVLDCALFSGQGEFSAVGFSYGGPVEDNMPSRAGDPVEDLGEEASSDSDSGKKKQY